MYDALDVAPTVITRRVSIVRLHGEACFDCGAVHKTLHSAGHVVLSGGTRVWEIFTCGCRNNGAPW